MCSSAHVEADLALSLALTKVERIEEAERIRDSRKRLGVRNWVKWRWRLWLYWCLQRGLCLHLHQRRSVVADRWSHKRSVECRRKDGGDGQHYDLCAHGPTIRECGWWARMMRGARGGCFVGCGVADMDGTSVMIRWFLRNGGRGDSRYPDNLWYRPTGTRKSYSCPYTVQLNSCSCSDRYLHGN